MKTLAHPDDKAEIFERLHRVRSDSVRRWGVMSAPQMICHLADASRMAIGEKPVSPLTGWRSGRLVKRTMTKG